MSTYFKSDTGKNIILALYDRKLTEVEQAGGYEFNSQYITTDWGLTHLLVGGNASKPTVVILHGSNAHAPIALECFPRLAAHFHVIAIDVPAQPNRSEAERPNMNDLSYGRWLNQLLEALDLTGVYLLGFSWGGLIALKTLAHDGSRVKAALLVAPAYIVNGNMLKLLFKMFLPLKRYIRKSRASDLYVFLDLLFSNPDEYAKEFLEAVFKHFTLDFNPVPVISTKEAGRIDIGIHIFAGENDILFPGKKMLKRAQKIFPTLQHQQLLESKHVFGAPANRMVEDYLIKLSTSG